MKRDSGGQNQLFHPAMPQSIAVKVFPLSSVYKAQSNGFSCSLVSAASTKYAFMGMVFIFDLACMPDQE